MIELNQLNIKIIIKKKKLTKFKKYYKISRFGGENRNCSRLHDVLSYSAEKSLHLEALLLFKES